MKAIGPAFGRDAFGGYGRAPSGEPVALASFDAMVAEAKRRWNGEAPYYLRIRYPDDANGTVAMRRNRSTAIDLNVDVLHFDVGTGEVLHEHKAQPVVHAQRFIAGLHFIQFEHWPLRLALFRARPIGLRDDRHRLCLLAGDPAQTACGARAVGHTYRRRADRWRG